MPALPWDLARFCSLERRLVHVTAIAETDITKALDSHKAEDPGLG